MATNQVLFYNPTTFKHTPGVKGTDKIEGEFIAIGTGLQVNNGALETAPPATPEFVAGNPPTRGMPTSAIPTGYYGKNIPEAYLAEPVKWITVKVDGEDYAIPVYKINS